MLNWQYIQWPLGCRKLLCFTLQAANLKVLTTVEYQRHAALTLQPVICFRKGKGCRVVRAPFLDFTCRLCPISAASTPWRTSISRSHFDGLDSTSLCTAKRAIFVPHALLPHNTINPVFNPLSKLKERTQAYSISTLPVGVRPFETAIQTNIFKLNFALTFCRCWSQKAR